MTIPESGTNPAIDPEVQELVAEQIQDERKRRLLLGTLIVLLTLICGVGFFFFRYASQPQPLPEMLPEPIAENIIYPPSYQFSIRDVDKPIGLAVSPDGQRIYVSEGGGERLIKMFDRDGNLIQSFAPPGTDSASRKPAYIAIDASGRVFVTDHYNATIAVFDQDGNFLEGIISPDLTLSEVVAQHNEGEVPEGTLAFYSNIDKKVYFHLPDQPLESVDVPERIPWTPLGLRFDGQGNLLVTNLVAGKHSVMILPAAALNGSWLNFNPQAEEFGVEGKEDGQLSFPNSVVTDSRGNFYVSDGNNGRISLWSPNFQYQTFFGFGSGEGALNLPRGMWIDSKDHLHVADAVGQFIRVYDVAGADPVFLYTFGNFGNTAGLFNYPTDISMDASRRVYIADRENNQVQIWSY